MYESLNNRRNCSLTVFDVLRHNDRLPFTFDVMRIDDFKSVRFCHAKPIGYFYHYEQPAHINQLIKKNWYN